ncbi:hypothetical protein CSQ85_12015 [Bifidobacterium rousetti]|uniref:hypothetical protein n=1 Tax=Bifidobacterium rousetti TaxID=2045439 RepID=UPI0012397598|nr:hypothetical protein [Bifidobacterium rousetti]KAA8816143.1 hypothetical protein CSQ85_12015 [Bifidobacterium rousetti]
MTVMHDRTLAPYRPIHLERDTSGDHTLDQETIRRIDFAAGYYQRPDLTIGEAMTVITLLKGVTHIDDHPTGIGNPWA